MLAVVCARGAAQEDFGVSNSLLGTLGAEYFYLYVLNQVPVGAAIAHWGVRKVLIVFMTLALAGNVLFAVTPAEAGLHVGRLLIGVGVSSAFLSFVTVIKEWFDPAEAALVMGLSMAVGVSGAIMGQVRTRCAGAVCGGPARTALTSPPDSVAARAMCLAEPAVGTGRCHNLAHSAAAVVCSAGHHHCARRIRHA